ncbi:MAG: NAD-dependent epimerase/dehydratase family protein, partial [Myxococcota bacterium]
MTKRALVTGGAGFIGSHVAEALHADGLEVRVLDDLSTGNRDNLPQGVTFIEGSILDGDAVRRAL